MFKEFVAVNLSHQPPYELWEGRLISHAEQVARVANIHDALKRHNPESIVYPEDFQQVPLEVLKQVHLPEYVDYLLSLREKCSEDYWLASSFGYGGGIRRPTEEHGLLGYYSMDSYTPVNNKTTEAALIAASGAYSAALSLEAGNRAAYAVVRPPGHHSGKRNMGGYCYLNNTAIAAHTLSQQGRVGILDVDYHHGNGTFDIFEQNQKQGEAQAVYPISIHADPGRKFPYRSGYEDQAGNDHFKYKNYPLGEGVTDEEYNRVLLKALQDLADYNPDFLVVSMGFDTYGGDPIADFALTTSYYRQMAKEIMDLKLKTLFVQEGGYEIEAIGDNALSLVKGIKEGLK